jgi:hypothetical protein
LRKYVYVYATHATEPFGRSIPPWVPKFCISLSDPDSGPTRTIALVEDRDAAELIGRSYAQQLGVDFVLLSSAEAPRVT